MIRAILTDGRIQPLDPLPKDWAEGQVLVVEEGEAPVDAEALAAWEREMEEAARSIPAEEHERLLRALVEIEAESKDAVKREWGLP
jgi:hypothetical protein